MKLAFTKKSIILIILVLAVIAWGIFREPVFKFRVTHGEKFISCKQNAQKIPGHGFFNLCQKKDVSGGWPANISYLLIIYDSNNVSALEYCQKYDTSQILRQNFQFDMEQQVSNITKISDNYYLLFYSTDFPTSEKCGRF